jgi:subtilisin family serine protease
MVTMRGTSVAAAFVTATAALLLEAEPSRSPSEVRTALLGRGSRRSIIPPMLDARASLAMLR